MAREAGVPACPLLPQTLGLGLQWAQKPQISEAGVCEERKTNDRHQGRPKGSWHEPRSTQLRADARDPGQGWQDHDSGTASSTGVALTSVIGSRSRGRRGFQLRRYKEDKRKR